MAELFPCPINWFIQSAAQYADNAHLWDEVIKVCIQSDESYIYITDIILKWLISFLHIVFNYICQNHIFSSHKLICTSRQFAICIWYALLWWITNIHHKCGPFIHTKLHLCNFIEDSSWNFPRDCMLRKLENCSVKVPTIVALPLFIQQLAVSISCNLFIYEIQHPILKPIFIYYHDKIRADCIAIIFSALKLT